MTSKNSIEKKIELKAPVSRVWRALTDYREFGQWFRVHIDGPFKPNEASTGHMLYPGFEHVKWEALIKKIEPQTLFSYTWHPFAIEPDIDYSKEIPTLVEFKLEPTTTGTMLYLTESGFENVPAERRAEAFEMDEGGWESQMANIQKYVSDNP